VVGPIGFAAGKAVVVVAVHTAAGPVADSIARGALDLVVGTVGMSIENTEMKAVVLAVVAGVCYTLIALVDKETMCRKELGLPVARKATAAAHTNQDAEA